MRTDTRTDDDTDMTGNTARWGHATRSARARCCRRVFIFCFGCKRAANFGDPTICARAQPRDPTDRPTAHTHTHINTCTHTHVRTQADENYTHTHTETAHLRALNMCANNALYLNVGTQAAVWLKGGDVSKKHTHTHTNTQILRKTFVTLEKTHAHTHTRTHLTNRLGSRQGVFCGLTECGQGQGTHTHRTQAPTHTQ